MNGKLISIGGGVAETGGGWVISYFFPNLLWLGYALIGIGIVTIVLGITWKFAIKCSKWLKSKIVLFCRVITRIPESGKLLSLKDEQGTNPEKWLFPVIEYIDLNRQGVGSTKNDVFVKFSIDSGLLEPINKYYVSVKMRLKDTTDYQESESDWCEVKQEGRYPPIRPLARSTFTVEKIHMDDGLLLEMMNKFRKGQPILSMLTIGVKFKSDDSPQVLEVSKFIAPMNNYRGG